jgi:ligand-binding SRPBCC domain-containing protein
MAKEFELERVQLVERPLAEVFAFFADAYNLERITPPFLHFKVLTPSPIEMRSGALIDYRIKLFGAPMRWRTVIEEFTPGVRFVDRQLKGPYKLWHHTHEFYETGEGTVMTDRVRYRIGYGPLGPLAKRFFVERTLDRIFDYRYRTIAEIFTRSQASTSLAG